MVVETRNYYYSLLQITPDSSTEEIKKNFRKLALRYHPDKNKDPEAHQKFQELNHAFHLLSDPIKRSAYDSNGGIELRSSFTDTELPWLRPFFQGTVFGGSSVGLSLLFSAFFGAPFGFSTWGFAFANQLFTAWQASPKGEDRKDVEKWSTTLGVLASPVLITAFLIASTTFAVGQVGRATLEFGKRTLIGVGEYVNSIVAPKKQPQLEEWVMLDVNTKKSHSKPVTTVVKIEEEKKKPMIEDEWVVME